MSSKMKISECNHIRIRDNNNYGMNVERTIKHLEEFYHIDFRTLPQWEKLVQRLHLAITDCKRKIQDSKRRKATIIDKLYMESCRPGPFQLTNELVRTAKIWQTLEANLKMKNKSMITLTESVRSSLHEDTVYEEMQGEASIGHPNTEAISSLEPTVKEEIATTLESHLPVYVCSNQHKRLSVLQFNDSALGFADSGFEIMSIKCDKKPDEWLVLPKNTDIISAPSIINIQNHCVNEQTISFSLTNLRTDYPYLNLRYKGLTDNTPFRRAKILPVTPVKLYPGLAVNFKFVFKLQPDSEDFSVNLFFKVGQKVLADAPVEGFCLPVVGTFFIKPQAILVSEVVNMPPTYFWHVNAKSGYPHSYVTIKIPDNHDYEVHVAKLDLNLVEESEKNDVFSIEPMTPSSMTIAQREQDAEVIAQSKTFVSSIECLEETDSIIIQNSISIIINDAIQRALDVFVFEKTFLPLKPCSRQSIKVCQTKVEHIGFHQSLYELKFTDASTSETVLRKTVKVFGEVLPNPVQIEPGLLDMTVSPIVYGRCEEHFTIVNNHKTFPVTIKIKLTTKMKQLIRIIPMETLIPTNSRVKFAVGLCSKDLNKNVREDFVHMTIKIIVIGDKSVYHNVPPIYYEILAPCSSEFMKLYKSGLE